MHDWRAIEELFNRVADVAPEERETLLQAAEAGLADEVRSLLAAEHAGGDRVDGLAQQVVSQAVDRLAVDRSASESKPGGVSETGAPQTIGPYRVLGLLGAGGFGSVYLAEKVEESFRLEVAIKLVHAGLGPRDLERRLLLERRILARLAHPNIARLLDGGTADDGRPFLVMERVEGESIDIFCDRRSLDIRGRLRCMLDVCSAVAYAHRSLVIHRDIKPSNTLVTDDGTVKLLDFGIAKLLDPSAVETEASPGLTLTGQLPFTPTYASPEQVRGEALGTATDVYSLGVMLYRLLSGYEPYRIESPWVPSRIEDTVCEQIPPRMSDAVIAAAKGSAEAQGLEAITASRSSSAASLARSLRGDLDKIVAKALRKEPERRYASVQALADDIRRHLENQPVLAAGDSWAYVFRRFVRRHRLAVASAALLLLVLSAGIVSTTVQMHQAERHRARTQQVMNLLLDDVFGSAAPERARGELPSAREILDRSAGDLDRRLVGSPDLHATVLVSIGRLYQRLGVYDRALVFLQRGQDRLRLLHGARHRETLQAASHLADALADLGHHLAARDLLRRTVADQRSLSGEASMELATSLHRLGLVELALQEPRDAEPAIAEALGIRRHLFGDQSLPVAESLAARAKLEYGAGRAEAAEASVREALAIRRAAHGEDHPEVLVSLNDLAVIVQGRRDFATAEGLFRRVVEINERIHGAEHRNLANALSNLGWVIGRQGRGEEAVPWLVRARAIYRSSLGEDHPLVSTVQRNLARLHQSLDAFEAAEALLVDNIERCRRVEGEGSLCDSRATLDLGSLELARGRYAEAADLFAAARERLDVQLPADDWRRSLPRFEGGRALLGLRRLDQAEALLSEAAEGFERILGPESSWTRRARQELVRCQRLRASSS